MFKIIGVDGREYGPVSADVIRQWIADRRANGETKVQPEGQPEWQPLSSLPEFADALNNAPTGAPPPALGTGAPPAPAAFPLVPLPPDVETRDYQIDIMGCIARGWSIVAQNFWLNVGATAVAWLIAGSVPFIAPIAYGGLYLFFLKQIRGQKVEFSDVFGGFTVACLQLFLGGLVKSLLGSLGVMLCVIPGIYLAVAWAFTIPLIADRRMEFWPAMELSRKVVNRHWWQVFGLLFVCWCLLILGQLCFCVGMFVALPVVFAAIACAYEDVFRTRPAAT